MYIGHVITSTLGKFMMIEVEEGVAAMSHSFHTSQCWSLTTLCDKVLITRISDVIERSRPHLSGKTPLPSCNAALPPDAPNTITLFLGKISASEKNLPRTSIPYQPISIPDIQLDGVQCLLHYLCKCKLGYNNE